MTLDTKELLNKVLEGDTVEPAVILELLRGPDYELEGQYHDLKSGRLFEKGKALKEDIRKDISAFANADGGLLFLGVSEKGKVIDGVPDKFGNEDPESWITKVIKDFGPYFQPFPVIRRIVFQDKTVILIAIPRAPRLIPVVQAGTLAYYLRIGSHTVPIPNFLQQDLISGRQKEPLLHVRVAHLNSHPKNFTQQVWAEIMLTNMGLIPAEKVQLGIVCWSLEGHGLAYNKLHDLHGYFDTHNNFNALHGEPFTLRIIWADEIPEISVFGEKMVLFRPLMEIPRSTIGFKGERYKSAFFLIAKNKVPSWYQLVLNGDLEAKAFSLIQPKLQLFQVGYGQRPLVAIE